MMISSLPHHQYVNYYNTLTLSFLISERKTNQLHLKENHDYYHQVQGQLHIANKMCCDLVIWTQEDLAIIRIARDDNWAMNIDKLINFYFQKFLPEVYKM